MTVLLWYLAMCALFTVVYVCIGLLLTQPETEEADAPVGSWADQDEKWWWV